MREENRHLKGWIAAAIVLAAAIILVSVRVTQVTVTNSKHYNAEQIESYLFPDKLGHNSLFVYLRDQFQPHEQIPFVQDYKLVFHSPFHVEVIVYEKDIVGYVREMSSYMYFDRDGIIVESTSTQLEGIPQIVGLRFGQIVLYEPLPVKDPSIFQSILNLTQQLSEHELSVDEIRYDTQGNASLKLGQMEVDLGKGENMDSKITVLQDILKKPENYEVLTKSPGTLDLKDYNDEGIGGGITFRKK